MRDRARDVVLAVLAVEVLADVQVYRRASIVERHRRARGDANAAAARRRPGREKQQCGAQSAAGYWHEISHGSHANIRVYAIDQTRRRDQSARGCCWRPEVLASAAGGRALLINRFFGQLFGHHPVDQKVAQRVPIMYGNCHWKLLNHSA